MRRQVKINRLLVIAGGLLIAAAIAGCTPDTSAPELRQETIQPEPTDVPAAAEQDEADETVRTDRSIARVEFTDQACLDCHTDQARLQELAVEEEDLSEELSEGPG